MKADWLIVENKKKATSCPIKTAILNKDTDMLVHHTAGNDNWFKCHIWSYNTTVHMSYLVYEYLLLCLLHESLTIGFRHVDIMCCSSLEEVIRGTRHIGTYSSLDFFSACKMVDNIFNRLENIYFLFLCCVWEGWNHTSHIMLVLYWFRLLSPGLLFIATWEKVFRLKLWPF